MQMKITLMGTQSALNRLKKMKVNMKDFSKELDEVGRYMKQFYGEDVFATEGQIINERWRPLSINYGFKKREKYPGAGILVASGALKGGFRYVVNVSKMKFWNPVVYAAAHNFGYPKDGSRTPRRTFFKVDALRKKKIVDIIHKGFIRRINGI